MRDWGASSVRRETGSSRKATDRLLGQLANSRAPAEAELITYGEQVRVCRRVTFVVD
jgi:hypothetical protein